MQYISHLRSIMVNILLIICMMFSAKSAIAANTSLFLLKDSPKNKNPSLNMCVNVISEGIRFEIPSFKHGENAINKSLYIYDDEQWVIEVSEGRFSCDYLGELYDHKLKDGRNLTLREKVISLENECGMSGKYDKLCSKYFRGKVITDTDFDICFGKGDKQCILPLPTIFSLNTFYR